MEIAKQKAIASSRSVDNLRLLLMSGIEGATGTTQLLYDQLIAGEMEKLGVQPRDFFQTIIHILSKIRDSFPQNENDFEWNKTIGIQTVAKNQGLVAQNQREKSTSSLPAPSPKTMNSSSFSNVSRKRPSSANFSEIDRKSQIPRLPLSHKNQRNSSSTNQGNSGNANSVANNSNSGNAKNSSCGNANCTANSALNNQMLQYSKNSTAMENEQNEEQEMGQGENEEEQGRQFLVEMQNHSATSNISNASNTSSLSNDPVRTSHRLALKKQKRLSQEQSNSGADESMENDETVADNPNFTMRRIKPFKELKKHVKEEHLTPKTNKISGNKRQRGRPPVLKKVMGKNQGILKQNKGNLKQNKGNLKKKQVNVKQEPKTPVPASTYIAIQTQVKEEQTSFRQPF